MKIGIIGFGNMGEAIYKRLAHGQNEIFVYEKESVKLEQYNLINTPLTTKLELDFILVCIKPKDLASISELSWCGHFISILAGIKIQRLKTVLPSVKWIRLMPNTPLLVGQGISGVYYEPGLTANEISKADQLLKSFTALSVVEKEDLLDAVTALSGSGPAYIYILIEAMADAGVKCGLSRVEAQRLAAKTVLGSAAMVLDTGLHPGVLKDQVASPGGTTIEGIAALESFGFRSAIIKAVEAAYEKAKFLGK
jgi:pyrroline-5-carboxylate reductase